MDLRNAEFLHHVALSAEHSQHAGMLTQAVDSMKKRINEFADGQDLKLVVAIVRPKQLAAASTPASAAQPTKSSGTRV